MTNSQLNFINSNTSLPSLMEAVVKQSYIIDYGIIKEVVADGIVRVAVSVATSGRDYVVMDCILAGFTAKAFTLNIKPNVRDKVMVFYPRRYDSAMFDPAEDDIIINEYATGYNVRTGIAVLLGQKRDDTHKNLLEIATDGSVTYTVGEDSASTTLTISADGEVNLTCNKGVTVSSSSSVTIKGSTGTLEVS